ncbi:MAG: PGN_0703 family putative restriction endonuclease [Acidobacteriota bacterium]
MAELSSGYAGLLRIELMARNRLWARGRPHVESYGSAPVIVYAPECGRHGNFFDPAYAAILARPQWLRRFDKVHTQAARALPKAERRWRELDSSMSSDALLMNVFCTPGVADSAIVRRSLGIEDNAEPEFGWKARVPLRNSRFDRTEVDMRLGSLLVEAKLTESDFQSRAARIVETYRDFDQVFDRERLPRMAIATARVRRASEDPENVSQEFESMLGDPEARVTIDPAFPPPGEPGYASYQLIRNVLAAHAGGCSFCVLHDERRPDLREQWFQVIAAVRNAELRTRLKVLTWQELAALLPGALQQFLDLKYGIAAPGKSATAAEPLQAGSIRQTLRRGL